LHLVKKGVQKDDSKNDTINGEAVNKVKQNSKIKSIKLL